MGLTWFVDSLGDEVVDEYTNISIRSRESKLIEIERRSTRVNSSEDSLRRRFLVSRCAVDLSSEEESLLARGVSED